MSASKLFITRLAGTGCCCQRCRCCRRHLCTLGLLSLHVTILVWPDVLNLVLYLFRKNTSRKYGSKGSPGWMNNWTTSNTVLCLATFGCLMATPRNHEPQHTLATRCVSQFGSNRLSRRAVVRFLGEKTANCCFVCFHCGCIRIRHRRIHSLRRPLQIPPSLVVPFVC